ncbi:MAG: sugar transferase [Syntrophobacterales bacterium]|nr:sugar transferase [Syntrophobacterales bacterium]
MGNLHPSILFWGLKFFDLGNLVFCLFLAVASSAKKINLVSLPQLLARPILVTDLILFLGFALIWHKIFTIFGLYRSKRLTTWKAEIIDIINATALGALVLFLMSVVFRIQLATPRVVFLFWAYASSTTICARLLLRYFLERLRSRGINLQNLLIVGTNLRALNFARQIESRMELGYRIIGFVDDTWSGTEKFLESGYPLVANFASLPSFLRNNVVNEVVIDLPIESLRDQMTHIIAQCVEQGIVVRCISDSYLFLRKVQAPARLDLFEDSILVTVQTGAMKGWPVWVKAGFDFFLSLLLIAFLSPAFLLIALAIKINSPGPVFFVQERVGLEKRRFRMIKFRTMYKDSEQRQAELEALNEASGPVFKLKEDPRVTTVGRFLRRTSLDEMPQLFNVLKGDMSLVGPRPLPVRDYQGFSQDWHRRRFSVRPGITCLWQAEGRSCLPFEIWMHLDMKYIDEWSLWLDLKILAKTVIAVFKRTGAY